MATSLTSLFNPQSPGVQAPVSRNTDEYKVNFKDGKGGVYESVVRFIPYVANPEKSIMTKQVSWVKNPITQKGLYVDDPRSVGDYSPIVDMFFKCYNSGNAQVKDFGKNHLSTKQQYASLVQIIKDDQHPELVGKIKVLKYGKKVWDKLYNEEHPAMGTGYNPFHPIYGRYFYIKCVSQSGFNNFDQSYFFSNEVNGVKMTGFYYEDPSMPGQLQYVTEQSNQQAVADWLAANSPDLSKYDYTPQTKEQKEFVDEVLAIISNYLQGGGNMQMNLQTINTPQQTQVAGLQVNNAPVFPGAAAQPVAPSIPVPGGMPAPAAPAVSIPTPSVQAPSVQIPSGIPAPSIGGGLTMGESTIPGMAPTAAPSISGIEIPTVEAPNVGYASTPSVGFGNIEDVVSQL